MSKTILKTHSKPTRRHLGYKRLQGLMREYDITIAELAKNIGRASCTVSLSNNGYNFYDSMDMLNIQKLINSKAVKSGKKYTIDDIFFS
jgi:hypothetical protein